MNDSQHQLNNGIDPNGYASDILDNDYVEQSEVFLHGVVISVPTLYVNRDENGRDEFVQNLRVVNVDTLEKLMKISIGIPSATHDDLTDVWKQLMTILIQSNKRASNENEILQFLSFTTKVAHEMDLEDEYLDTMNCSCISFDVIRQYVNDPTTTLLISSEPKRWRNVSFYSQLGDDQEAIMLARQECNDTDMNRFHYCLQMFEKTLKFENGYIFNSTIKLMNLCLMYLCLINCSNPIRCMSSNDLKSNFLGYMIDAVVRSRIMQAWLRSPSSKILLSDIAHNYDEKQIMVALCKLKTAKDRAKFVLSQLSQNKNIESFVKCLSYEAYEEVLNKSCAVIQGVEYYVFDNRFLMAIVSINGFDALRNLYNNASSSTNNSETTTTTSDELTNFILKSREQ